MGVTLWLNSLATYLQRVVDRYLTPEIPPKTSPARGQNSTVVKLREDGEHPVATLMTAKSMDAIPEELALGGALTGPKGIWKR